MSTNLYGTVKKVASSSFIFDRIYSNRVAMENAKNTDGVYHGRYILVSYGDKFSSNNENDATIIINNDNVEHHYSINYDQDWIANYNIDLEAYSNVYDKTVWQKIFDGTSQKYIMVASLNARAPGLTINEDYYSFNLPEDENGETYYTKVAGSADVNTSIRKASYPIPKWHETISNDLIYHLDMPMPLKINLGKELNYFQEGLSPSTHSVNSSSNNLDQSNNYIRWEHILKDSESNKVIGADFNFNIPAIGQAISDTYDALYGLPASGTQRPTSNTDLPGALAQTANLGIIGVLANLGLVDETTQTYKLKANWNATQNEFGYIENKPQKITNIAVNEKTGLWSVVVDAN